MKIKYFKDTRKIKKWEVVTNIQFYRNSTNIIFKTDRFGWVDSKDCEVIEGNFNTLN